jgi:8-oxo-dGTP diphosphatase
MPDEPQIIQRIATKAVIVDDKGKVLILREADTYEEGTNIGKYHMPGGRLNPGEAFLDGLKREVDEETGLKIEIGKPIYVGEWRPVIKDVQNQIVAIFFICKPLSKDVRLSEEHDDFQWIEPSKYSDYNVMAPENKVIEAYLSSIS